MSFRTTPAAYDLLQRGLVAHAEIEHAGMRIDRAYLEAVLASTAAQIREAEDELRADPIFRKYWQRRYGERTKLAAPAQLAGVVYGDLGYTPAKQTAGGQRGAADEASLEAIDLPFIKTYFRAQKLRKGRGTYLTGIQREMVRHADGNWYVHPSWNLNTTVTYRPSCDNPNVMNVPTRNEVLGEMIRRCYIPRPGHQLIEIDYSQVEVRVAACYNHDPKLIAYINDPKSDMHRDMARKLFFLKVEQVTKPIRGLAKGAMVFAQFYGDYYPHCTKNLWSGATELTVGETPLIQHLAAHGIDSCGACDPDQPPADGTFEKHVQGVERWMWGEQFPAYAQWKRDWFRAYQEHAGFMMLTGFAVNGRRSRNEIINAGIQGSAYHCLLWSLIKLVNRLLKHRFRSRIIAEVYDCIVADVWPPERDDYINMARTIMVDEIARVWDWLIVPLGVDPEGCEPDVSWYEKKAYIQRDGRWGPKPK